MIGTRSVAALLVPLHHKIEKWATGKLVEKNKAIRLASTKKTIEKLNRNPEELQVKKNDIQLLLTRIRF